MARYGRRYGNFYGTDAIEVRRAYTPPSAPESLRVEWETDRTATVRTLIYLDRALYGSTLDESAQLAMRQRELHLIELFEAGYLNWDEEIAVGLLASIPGDRVRLSWDRPSAGDPTEYRVYWDAGTGTIDYNAAIAVVKDTGAATYSWTTSRLDDGTYKFGVRARNVSTNEETNVSVIPITIDTYPASVNDLAHSFDDPTHTLTLSWTESESSDVAGYRIYSNGGSGDVDYSSSIGDVATESFDYDMTGLTGDYRFGVRAYDASAQEEQNIDVWIDVTVDAGDLAMVPNAPSGLAAQAIAGGVIRLSWRYNTTIPAAEGAACDEFHVYYDNGTGTVNYGSSIGTVDNTGGIMTFDSGALSHGTTYKFGVRSVAASGAEEQNTTTASATADTSVPAAPTGLAGEVIP